MLKQYKIREYFEVYSKKNGMTTRSILYEDIFDTIEQAFDFFRRK